MSEGQSGSSGQAGRAAPLSRWSLFAYSLPAVPIAAMGLPLVVHLPPFYAKNLGLGFTVVGMIFMFARFWDVLTDPMLGVFSDRFETRWGRRRHWIVLSVPIMMVSVYMIMMPQGAVSPAYLVGWLFVMYVGWTLLTISHLSWGAELTPDYHERSHVQGWRELLLLIGVVVVMALPVILGIGEGETAAAERVSAMGWFVLLLMPITVAIAVLSVGERPAPRPEHVGFRQAIKVVIENRPLRFVLLADLISGVSGGIVASLFLFLAEDALQLGKFSNILLLCYFISGMVFIPLVLWISRRFGKHQTAAGSAMLNAVTIPLILFVPVGDHIFALGCWVLFGINMAAGPFLFRSIMADVADHDSVRSKQTRTGLFFSMLTSTNKVGGALAIGLSYTLLDVVGFSAGGQNTEAAIDGLRMVYVWPATIISFIVAIILWKFPLGETEQRANRAILDQRILDAAAAGVESRTLMATGELQVVTRTNPQSAD
ncbi:MAG: MFS transporter [Parvibaculaceae bacterium]